MHKKPSLYSVARTVWLFEETIDEVKPYMQSMQAEVKRLCSETGQKPPRAGHGATGLMPNFSYAVKYFIAGLSPQAAAIEYMKDEHSQCTAPEGYA